MNTVKRFVCYYAGINVVLAALLLGLAWVAPEDDSGAAPAARPQAVTATASAKASQVSAPAPLLASAEMPFN